MQYNTRILIVDDNQSIHDDFKKVLCVENSHMQEELADLEAALFGSGTSKRTRTVPASETVKYEIDSAFQGKEALDMIAKAEAEGRPYSMAFMDVRMPPGWDGIESIMRIWEKYPHIEMVLCTAYSDYSWEDIHARLGNTDKLLFLRKPFDAIAVQQMALSLIKKWNLGKQARDYTETLEEEVLERTRQIQNVLSELETKNQQLEESNKALEHAALHDSLTGLPNRALFNDRLDQAIRTTERENTSFALVILDVDKFKDINDNNGHLFGDKVLIEFSKRITSQLRDSDTVARLGGDEFAIILPGVSDETVVPILKKISSQVHEPIMEGKTCMTIGSSIGAAIYPAHGKDSEALMHAADMAMYQSKHAGISYKVYDPDEDELISDIDQLVIDLRMAIDNSQLTLNYQPIVDLQNNRVVSVEALSRWIHPERGFVPPDQFISVAEQKGLIQSLTRWMMNEAFSQCASWRKAGATINMSVNLSVRNFLDPQLPEKIREAMDAHHVKPEWINLEITESMMMTNPDKALQIVKSFADMGLSLSIDDFGAGYSSLSYLKRLPVDDLKIDRSFIMDMDNDPEDRIIVQSTIELAHNLGRKVVAEGVENETILNLLRQLGCDKVQGYHLCRPQPASDISSWFFDSEWAVSKAS